MSSLPISNIKERTWGDVFISSSLTALGSGGIALGLGCALTNPVVWFAVGTGALVGTLFPATVRKVGEVFRKSVPKLEEVSPPDGDVPGVETKVVERKESNPVFWRSVALSSSIGGLGGWGVASFGWGVAFTNPIGIVAAAGGAVVGCFIPSATIVRVFRKTFSRLPAQDVAVVSPTLWDTFNEEWLNLKSSCLAIRINEISVTSPNFENWVSRKESREQCCAELAILLERVNNFHGRLQIWTEGVSQSGGDGLTDISIEDEEEDSTIGAVHITTAHELIQDVRREKLGIETKMKSFREVPILKMFDTQIAKMNLTDNLHFVRDVFTQSFEKWSGDLETIPLITQDGPMQQEVVPFFLQQLISLRHHNRLSQPLMDYFENNGSIKRCLNDYIQEKFREDSRDVIVVEEFPQEDVFSQLYCQFWEMQVELNEVEEGFLTSFAKLRKRGEVVRSITDRLSTWAGSFSSFKGTLSSQLQQADCFKNLDDKFFILEGRVKGSLTFNDLKTVFSVYIQSIDNEGLGDILPMFDAQIKHIEDNINTYTPHTAYTYFLEKFKGEVALQMKLDDFKIPFYSCVESLRLLSSAQQE